ncbi:fibroleukin-like [Branchiostoma floridae]|uniref:Fibroleukin-like n=1 Tax=Branchiostoma floridae TaxID=7739 RepID=A0A9J7MJ34_BRAFL|nr:fibroleukin-like [Branchiostoma floridae]
MEDPSVRESKGMQGQIATAPPSYEEATAAIQMQNLTLGVGVPSVRTVRATVVQAFPAQGPDYLKLNTGDQVQVITQHVKGMGGVWVAVHSGKVGKVSPVGLKVHYEPVDLVPKPPTSSPQVQTLTAQAVRPHTPSGPGQLTLQMWEVVQVVDQPPTGPWAVVSGDKLGMVDPGCLKIMPCQQASLREQLYRDGKTGRWISDLRGRGLHSLPGELFTLSETSELYITDNLLTALPDALTGLPNLLRLSAGRNKLGVFPEVVLRMTRLENLNIGENDFCGVPRNIGHLQNLKELWLKSLNLQELPDELCLLQNLELLHLGWNNLTRLPGNFAQLSSLNKLLMQHNRFQQFPEQVCFLASLRELYLDQGTGEKFTVIPDSIGNLRKLRVMVLDNNALTSLPTTVDNANDTEADKPQAQVPHDCQDILDDDETTPSGVYMVYPRDNLGGFLVFCDMDTDGGGWTLFQKRQDGTVDFFRDWADYKTGFPSNLNGEFWLGNDKLYRLAVQKVYQLRVDMEDVEGNTAYAAYSTFAISPESQNYKLHIGTYTGTAGDSLSLHDGKPFSTKDRDNDESSSGSCAQSIKGAWWYGNCHHSNLNGLYHLGTHDSHGDGVNWYHWKGYKYSLKRTEMKIRPTP